MTATKTRKQCERLGESVNGSRPTSRKRRKQSFRVKTGGVTYCSGMYGSTRISFWRCRWWRYAMRCTDRTINSGHHVAGPLQQKIIASAAVSCCNVSLRRTNYNLKVCLSTLVHGHSWQKLVHFRASSVGTMVPLPRVRCFFVVGVNCHAHRILKFISKGAGAGSGYTLILNWATNVSNKEVSNTMFLSVFYIAPGGADNKSK